MSQTSISTTMALAYAGLLADSGFHDVISRVNGEASAEIRFGAMVAQDTADDECDLLAADTDKPIGVVVHSHAYDKPNDLGDTGLKPKAMVNVLRKGRIWVPVEEAVVAMDPVFVRHTVADSGSFQGAFRKSDDNNETIDLTGVARFLTSASASGFAVVEVDMSNY